MATLPQLLAWMICDKVYIDPATGKHFLLGCFSNIRMRQFPGQHPSMTWFLSLTDVKPGNHTLRVLMGKTLESSYCVLERDFESQSPLHRINLINEVINLAFEEPGVYQIEIEVDNHPLLVTSINVTP